ncbi:MAG: sensor histidine kinase [Ktedonobacterales bacterium]
MGNGISPAERTLLDELDAQRRLGLLRVIVPALLVVALLQVPSAIHADVENHWFHSSLQVGIGVIAFLIALWATWRRWVNVASFAVFAGITGTIMALLTFDVLLGGPLSAFTLPEFQLLALPIVVAGIFGSPRLVVGASITTLLFTFGLILLTPRSVELQHLVSNPGGLAIYTVPMATQLVLGILTYAATRAFNRTLRELGATRIAYAREKELDRLKDHFISSVNHELRTPIMALQGYVELSRELAAQGDYARQATMLERSAEAVSHLAGLVTSVLNIRRVEADAANLTLTAFALEPVVVGATHLLDPKETGQPQRPIHVSVPADLRVHADEERVRQVLLNLLSNAAKYSPPGSAIDITARAHEPGRRGGRGPAPDTHMVEIAVRDYGLGIPPNQAVLLFQRFVRLERDMASPVVGTGLGLAICRTYVEAMGGRIWVESSGVPDEGSTFIFTLPLG